MQSLPFFYFVRIRCNPTAACRRTCTPGRHREGSNDSQDKHGHNLCRDTQAPCRRTDRRRVRTVRSAAGVDPCGRSGIPILSFNHSPALKIQDIVAQNRENVNLYVCRSCPSDRPDLRLRRSSSFSAALSVREV